LPTVEKSFAGINSLELFFFFFFFLLLFAYVCVYLVYDLINHNKYNAEPDVRSYAYVSDVAI